MNHLKSLILALPFLLSSSACEDSAKKGAETTDQVIVAWNSAQLGSVKLEAAKESETYAGGSCRSGKVADLRVDLCEFKDALSADSAKDQGLVEVGANTGAALVRDRYLLVVADVDKVDAHGKVLNQVAKIFLEPPSPAAKVPLVGD
jgi:hypothetical protein